MSLIFDGFPRMTNAEQFRTAVKQRFGLDGHTFSSDEDAYQHDVFPFQLTPPIVHIDRPDEEAHPSLVLVVPLPADVVGMVEELRIDYVKMGWSHSDHELLATAAELVIEESVGQFVERFGGTYAGT